MDCLEGLLDGIDLLYGAEVTLTLHNIQPLLKFSLLYKVDGIIEGCLGWIKKKLSIVNLFTFLKVGLFVKSVEVDHEDILGLCKQFILTTTADELLDASETWTECKDETLVNFLLDKDMLHVTLPTITNWVNSESNVVMVLDRVDECGLQKTLSQIPTPLHKVKKPAHQKAARIGQADTKSSNPVLQLLEKMQGLCDTFSSSKRVSMLLSFILGQNYLQVEKLFHQPQSDSLTVLKNLQPKRWRKFDFHQIASLHYHHRLEGFFFAEIVLDWVRVTEPTEEKAEQLWGIVAVSRICKEYLKVVRNSLSLASPEADMPMPQGKNEYRFVADCYNDTDKVVDSLTGSVSTSIYMDTVECKLRNCNKPPECSNCKVFKLSDTTPCYQPAAVGPGHVQRDITTHWYATELKVETREWKDDTRVLLSFVTNTMAEVITKIRFSKKITLHFLQPKRLSKKY